MIGYVTLGTNDLARAALFYDAIAAELGVGRMMEFERFIAWGEPGGKPGIGLTHPFDGQAASVGNGVMVALEAGDTAPCPCAGPWRELRGCARPTRRGVLRRIFPRSRWQ